MTLSASNKGTALAAVSAMLLSLSQFGAAIADEAPTTAKDVARDNVLALNKAMMPIYESELTKFQTKFMNEHPIIVARFSGAGGHLTLYRPGKDPLVAADPPVVYQLAKSVGHSAMITFDMVNPYLDSADTSWKPQMSGFQSKVAAALKTLDDVDMSSDDKSTLRAVLTIINDYLSKCLSQDKMVKADLDAYAKTVQPYLPKLIHISASTQAKSQMDTLAEWKRLLGSDWDKTYAMTNSMYVTRQNNLIFGMLAEFMGKEAINHRLFLFETTGFTDTDEHLLNILARISSDEVMGDTMLGNFYAMNSELLANGGWDIIRAEAKRHGLTDILPDKEPFNSTDWPWRHNPKSGSGPASLFGTK